MGLLSLKELRSAAPQYTRQTYGGNGNHREGGRSSGGVAMVAKSAVIHLYVQYGSLEAKGLALAAVLILIVSSSSGITSTSPRPDGKDGGGKK